MWMQVSRGGNMGRSDLLCYVENELYVLPMIPEQSLYLAVMGARVTASEGETAGNEERQRAHYCKALSTVQ